MIELSAAEIAAITKGTITGDLKPETTVTDGSVDSRTCTKESIFIAKPGETTDGHLYIGAALKSGAKFALAERATQDSDGANHPAIIVNDVVEAMGLIAAEIVRRVRAHSTTTVYAITGSTGKTTTKDIMSALCGSDGKTTAPIGSYNSEVGVPLTVFQAELDTRHLVLEMGATGAGHLRYLVGLIPPDIAVVLNVGHAHAGEFGSQANIAAAKAEILETLTPEQTAVLNFDDILVREMATKTAANVIYFSADPTTWGTIDADTQVVATQTQLDMNLQLGTALKDNIGKEEQTTEFVRTGLLGEHHIHNILAAFTAARAAGLQAASLRKALEGLAAGSRWRMQRTKRDDGVVVINDAYNANPESMRAALKALAQLGRDTQQRTWAVLGEMLELGSEALSSHADLGETVVRLNITQLVVIGEGAKAAYNAAILEGSWGSEAHYVSDVAAAEELLQTKLQPGDIVLFKASNSVGLGPLGDKIAETKES